MFVHRLIGLYLRKNAQKAFVGVFDVSEDELKEIIVKITEMIEDQKCPEEIPYYLCYDDKWLEAHRFKIVECLRFQNNYENNIGIQSNDILNCLERNYSHSSEGKFLFFWLQTRAKVFEKYSDLKTNKEIQEEILTGYREAFDELLNNDRRGSPFLRQFLAEIILINYFFYPRRVRVINFYFEKGCTFGVFNADEEKEIINHPKKLRNTDIRKALINMPNHFYDIKIN